MQPSFNHDDMLMTPYIEHHGVLGMKWGIRKYQNKDGSLTPAGRERYLTGDGKLTKHGKKLYKKESKKLKELKKRTDLDYQERRRKLNGVMELGYKMKHDGLPSRPVEDQDWALRSEIRKNYDDARYLITVKGHDEAVQEYENYVKKMQKTYGKKLLKELESYDTKTLKKYLRSKD